VNLLPVVGLVVGFFIGDRRALAATTVLAGIGFALVAAFTDEIDGWGDAYVWIVLSVSLVATLLGIGARSWWSWRRRRLPA
jgi:hypothetical protein